MSNFKYKKIIVIGCSGAGKSTFSRKLAEIVNTPLYNLDTFYWKADATHITRSELIEKQNEIFKTESWIIDGNFRNTLELRFEQAELIYFLDFPKEICIDGVKNRKIRDEIPCVLPVNDELIGFINNFEKDVKPIILNLIKKYSDKKVITFHSRREADEYLEKLKTEKLLGKNVTVIIDRPLGSVHPKHKDLIYPVNYGYIEGIIAPDGEEQDAYVIGVSESLKQFTGKVIAIIHRFNDIEDKLVVADENSNFTNEDIKNQVLFQEKYFDFEIIV
ncbi:MAG: hypothetical protein ACI4V4_04535 [Eubacterium sp.]